MVANRKRAAALLACAIVFDLHAQAHEPVRPKVGLVLSGGGARGLAHIGVLKVLREQRVPVDFIVATSMGSIVGGAYAAGTTPDGMERLVREADWARIFSDRAPREDLSFRRKEDDLRLIGKTELGLKRDGPVLPRGALGSQNLEEFLRGISPHASDSRTLNDLPILFRAVATDLVTAEQVVLADVPLSVAMRASMSIPGAFAPAQVDGRLLGDGGLVRNLPVEVARDMGADIIIAVNVGTPLMPREALTSALGVAQQMINILTEQNVGISLAKLGPRDVLISPDLAGVSFVDFQRGEDLVARGEAAARAAIPRLAALAATPERYAQWEAQRTRHATVPELAVSEVKIEGTQRVNPEALRREIADRAGLTEGSRPTNEQLIKAARVLHGSGEFETVDVRTEIDKGRRSVVVAVGEKPWGPDYLRLGGRAYSDFSTESGFSLIVQHTRTWLNSWGAEWRNELELGETRRFMTSWFQPLGPGNPWFVEGVLQTTKSDFDLYEGLRRTDRISGTVTGAYALVGRRLGGMAVVRAGLGYERHSIRQAIGTLLDGPERDSARLARVGVVFDTLDDPNFPRRGFAASLDTTTVRYRLDDEQVQAYRFSGLMPFTWGRFTLLAIAEANRARDDRVGFNLGGFLNLSGTPQGAIVGSQSALAAGLAYYRLGQTRGALGGDVFAGVSLEAGSAWRRADGGHGNVRKAGSVFLGLDSIVGPVYFAYGKTFGGESAVYLFLGRPAGWHAGGGL